MEGGWRARAIACRRTGSGNNRVRAEDGTSNAIGTRAGDAGAARNCASVRGCRTRRDSASSAKTIASTVCPHASAAASFQTF